MNMNKKNDSSIKVRIPKSMLKENEVVLTGRKSKHSVDKKSKKRKKKKDGKKKRRRKKIKMSCANVVSSRYVFFFFLN